MTHKNTSSFCPLRAVGSGGYVGTGFWITTPCPSVTSGGVCLETSMLPMRGTTAGSSSLKVSNTHTNTHTLINAWFSTHNSQNMFSSSLRPVVFNSQKHFFYVLKDNAYQKTLRWRHGSWECVVTKEWCTVEEMCSVLIWIYLYL